MLDNYDDYDDVPDLPDDDPGHDPDDGLQDWMDLPALDDLDSGLEDAAGDHQDDLDHQDDGDHHEGEDDPYAGLAEDREGWARSDLEDAEYHKGWADDYHEQAAVALAHGDPTLADSFDHGADIEQSSAGFYAESAIGNAAEAMNYSDSSNPEAAASDSIDVGAISDTAGAISDIAEGISEASSYEPAPVVDSFSSDWSSGGDDSYSE